MSPPDAPPEDEGIEVSLDENGKVVIHARCRPGEDPAACRERVRFLVEALGEEGRVEVAPPPDAPGEGRP